MASFEGKVIAITGGASGIGLATAKLLASKGAILSIADANQAGLEAALTSLPKGTTITVLDVRDFAKVTEWVEKTIKDHGSLDGAVNMAGVARMGGMLKDEDDDAWDFVMNINAKGVFNCLRAQLKSMKEGGAIVNAASIAGMIGQPGAGIYCASKAAVIGLTKTAARENPHLRINGVAPGIISTPMIQTVEQKMGITFPSTQAVMNRQGVASEVAPLIVFLLSQDASFMTGTIYNIDGGFLT